MTSRQWARRKRVVVGLTFAFALLLGSIVGLVLQQSTLTIKHGAARDIAFSHAQRISQRLQEATGPTYMLASLVQQGGGKVPDFNTVGEELLQSFPMARAVELAPGGVVRQVYPLAGNEPILGHDLLKDRGRNQEAHVALTSRQLTIAGPFDLVQGGVGVVARYPVFLPDRNGRAAFWGFTIVLIRVPELLNAAGMTDLEREGYRYELCRIPPNRSDCVTFARKGEGAGFDDVVTVPVDVPNAHWMLSVVPAEGWVTGSEWISLAAIVLVLALFISGLQWFFLNSLHRPA